MSTEHESLIKTPRQLITVVILSFVVPILVIMLLVSFVTNTPRTGAGTQSMSPEAIEARIRPVAGFELRDASAPTVARAGDAVYKGQCAACHDSGAAGAPKLGDAGAWSARIKQGYDTLLTSALKGKGAMAAQAGGEYSDIEIAKAVVFMANSAGAKFAEPKAPAGQQAAEQPAAAPAASAPAAAAAPVQMAAAPAAPAALAAAPAALAATPATKGADGKATYEKGCNACHAAGVAGAPKFGDKAGWAPRLALGIDGLTASVIKGKGAMPAKGAVAGASDAELRAAVEYMVAAVK